MNKILLFTTFFWLFLWKVHTYYILMRHKGINHPVSTSGAMGSVSEALIPLWRLASSFAAQWKFAQRSDKRISYWCRGAAWLFPTRYGRALKFHFETFYLWTSAVIPRGRILIWNRCQCLGLSKLKFTWFAFLSRSDEEQRCIGGDVPRPG